MPDLNPQYPSRWETDVVVADGSTVYVRPVKPEDADRVEALHSRLSPETIYFRFFTPLPKLTPTMLERFVNVDYVDRLALVALLGQEIIAISRYDRIPGSSVAEVAFLVDDAHQGRGLASLMLEHLAAAAKENGITRFVADTLPENSKMLRVFHDAGFSDKRVFQDGVVRVTFDISSTEESIAAMYRRERVALERNISRLLNPKTVAVVGASRRPGSIGHRVMANILAAGFSGCVYPINPNAHSVAGVRAYSKLTEVPDRVDVAIIAVSSDKMEEVVLDAAEAKVGELVIMSSGFSEASEEGKENERQIVRLARRNGMRIVGPNSMGIANSTPEISLNASLSPFPILRGGASLHAQSGPLSLAILEEARRRGLGMATFVSSGNKADISGNDLLNYWETDPNTKVVMLYIEDFGNPRTFARVARRVSRSKPIIAVKSKRYQSKDIETMSSLDLNLPNDMAVEALFEQTGVLRVDTLEQLFELAQAIVNQPLPKGNRVAILSNSGGPAPLVADACKAVGLEIPILSERSQMQLRELAGSNGRVGNPVELPNQSNPESFGKALEIVLADPGIDSVIVSYIPTVTLDPLVLGSGDSSSTSAVFDSAPTTATHAVKAVAEAVSSVAASQSTDSTKPVLANFLALSSVPNALTFGTRTIPYFAFPESAAMALGNMALYAQWRQRPEHELWELTNLDPSRAKAVLANSLSGSSNLESGASSNEEDNSLEQVTKYLKDAEIREVLGAYGIEFDPNSKFVPEDSPNVVNLNLQLIHDISFGVFLSIGLAGFVTEVLGQRTIKANPQEYPDVIRLIDSMPGSQVLDGMKGAPPVDRKSLESLICRIAKLADDMFEVERLSFENLSILEKGYHISGVKLKVTNWAPATTILTRSLR